MRNSTNVFNSICKLLLSNKSKIRYFLGLMLCIFSIGFNVIAAPWDLDIAFGSGGKVVTDVPVGAADMALQPDGKIIMVGGYSVSAGAFTVARYNPNGSLDATFDGDGTASVSFGGSGEIALAVAVQPDGKIVVGGQATMSSLGNVAVARLNSNGSLDTTFNGTGKLVHSFSLFSIPYHTSCSSIKVANDGKIVFAGGGARMSVIGYVTVMGRLNADGSFDTTFDEDGVKFDGAGGRWKDLAIQADGTIVVVGEDATQFRGMMMVSKFSSSGGPIWSYARGQEFQFMSLNGVAVQPDGKTIAVGNSFGKIFAMRFNADGSIDTTFTEAANLPNGESRSVAVQADGKVIANVVFPSAVDGFSLIRYNTDGTVDTTFGTNGIVTTRISTNGLEAGNKVVIQPDGKILVGGLFNGRIGDKRGNSFVMARYLGSSLTTPAPKARFDFDGDRKTDVSIFRPSNGQWWFALSSTNSIDVTTFSVAFPFILVPADYTGDGKVDLACYRPGDGEYFILRSENSTYYTTQIGTSGDVPAPGDFDGDGKADVAVYRPSFGVWIIKRSSNNVFASQYFGTIEDKPAVADYDGDGKDDIAIYRPSTGAWWINRSSLGIIAIQFGQSGDKIVQGDYTGDGKAELALWRESNGFWYILRSEDYSFYGFPFGTSGDKPVPGDYDGDGKLDAGIFRPSDNVWYLLRSTEGISIRQFGTSGDIPLPNVFVR